MYFTIQWEHKTTSTADATIRGVTDKWVELPENLPPIGYIETGSPAATEAPVVVDYYRYSETTAGRLEVTRTSRNVRSYIPGTRKLCLYQTLFDTTTKSALGNSRRLTVTVKYRPVGAAPSSVL